MPRVSFVVAFLLAAALLVTAAGAAREPVRATFVGDSYRRTNVAIESAAKRWPELIVADWNTYSRNEPWFGRDGLHLSNTGASALASFLRARVLDVARRSS